MKKLFYILCLVGFPLWMSGQTDDENYVKVTDYRIETQDGLNQTAGGVLVEDDMIETISYYDGLGRPKQNINARSGGNRENIVQYVEYDEYSAEPKAYLPWASNGQVSSATELDLLDSATLKSDILSFYNTTKYENTANPYNERVFEVSPRRRPLELAAPGNDWDLTSGHTVKFGYSTNVTGDDVYRFGVIFGSGTDDPDLLLDVPGGFNTEYYSLGQLVKNVTKDENWTSGQTYANDHTTQEFTNKKGQLILTRTFNEGVEHDTYYVYDDFGNLTYVLSPEASSQIVSGQSLVSGYQQILDDLGYQYKYDHRNRLIEKKIPGKGWEYIVYNVLDQPVLTQDANLENDGKWLFTKYDATGRVVYTGKIINSASRGTLQATMNGISDPYESRTQTSNSVGGTGVYYTDTIFPTNPNEVLTVSYYDNYDDVNMAGLSVPATVYGVNTAVAPLGLPTVTQVKVLETAGSNWITSIIGYDDKSRVIYTASYNDKFLSEDEVKMQLDFTGGPLETMTIHERNGYDLITIRDYFTYDHIGRVLTHEQKIDDEPVQLITWNEYDELGQLVRKNVGGETFVDGYTDITNAEVTLTQNNGTTITRTGGLEAWNAGAKTRGEIIEDGGIQYVIPIGTDLSKKFRVGLVKTNNIGQVYDWDEFDFGIEHSTTPGQGSGIHNVTLIVNGVLESIPVGTFQEGDVLSIERDADNDEFIFSHDGNSWTFPDNGPFQDSPLIGKAALYHNGASIEQVELYGPNIDMILQNVDYKYNVRGWLTDINDIGNANDSKTTDLFNFRIHYNTQEPGVGGIKLYNGNISQTLWKSKNTSSEVRAYSYEYDAMNRINAATSYQGFISLITVSNDHNLSNISYGRNGNILFLDRQGYDDTGVINALWDDLQYEYDGNQLTKVTDTAPVTLKSYGFDDGNTGTNDYLYDDNGNMTQDLNKGISSITYNHLNLPAEIIMTAGGTIFYTHDAMGIKLQKNIVDEGLSEGTDYIGKFIYQDGLEFISHPEGYIIPVANTEGETKGHSGGQTTYSKFEYVFQHKDHLGNVRLSYIDADLNGSIDTSEIVEESNYYPFGLKQNGYNMNVSSNGNSVAQRWKFQGQELNEDFGFDAYEWKYRMSYPDLGRFIQIDPLAAYFPYNSPYNFAENRVIDGNEFEGMEWTRYRNPDGSTHYVVNFKVLNSTSTRDNYTRLSVDQVKTIASGIARQTESSFSGLDVNGNMVTVTANFELVDVVDPRTDYYVELVDIVMSDVFNSDGSEKTVFEVTGDIAEGKVRTIGNSQVNRMQVAVAPFTSSNQERIEGGAHELGHSVGLGHSSGNGDVFNLMTDGVKRADGGTNITPEQRSTVSSNVPAVTPASTITPMPIVPLPVPLPSGGAIAPIQPLPSNTPPPGTIIVPNNPRPDGG